MLCHPREIEKKNYSKSVKVKLTEGNVAKLCNFKIYSFDIF